MIIFGARRIGLCVRSIYRVISWGLSLNQKIKALPSAWLAGTREVINNNKYRLVSLCRIKARVREVKKKKNKNGFVAIFAYYIFLYISYVEVEHYNSHLTYIHTRKYVNQKLTDLFSFHDKPGKCTT